MTKLDDALVGVTLVGIDSAPFIYFVEADPRYDALVSEVFGRVAEGHVEAVSSVITLAEVLVQPFARGDIQLQSRYRDLLTNSEHLALLSIDPATAELAASLRVRHRLRMPDALQVAASLQAGCQVFLTNDTTLRQVADLRVIVLDDLLE